MPPKKISKLGDEFVKEDFIKHMIGGRLKEDAIDEAMSIMAAKENDKVTDWLRKMHGEDLAHAKNEEYEIFSSAYDMSLILKRPNGVRTPIDGVSSKELIEALRITFNTVVPHHQRRNSFVGGETYRGDKQLMNSTRMHMLQLLFKELAGRDDLDEGELHMVAGMADYCRKNF